MEESIKLQKYFSECGIMSRRRAEEEIIAGRVMLNGRIALITDRIIPGKDTVTYNGKTVEKKDGGKVYVLLNKPKDYICSLDDEKGRKCAFTLVKKLTDERVWTIGRLDRNSEGLIILTNDGELTNRLTHPRHEIPKIYRVWVRGEVTARTMEKLSSPIIIDGRPIREVECRICDMTEKDTCIEMVLYEGRNRQIRHLCDAAGLTVRRLIRVSIGGLKLGGLGSGKWRYLEQEEVEYLYRATKG
jgi:23S rRNA pseudouridine2605 synthase